MIKKIFTSVLAIASAAVLMASCVKQEANVAQVPVGNQPIEIRSYNGTEGTLYTKSAIYGTAMPIDRSIHLSAYFNEKNDGNGVKSTDGSKENPHTVKITGDVTLEAEYWNIGISVSETKQVVFAPGNLQATYHASTSSYTWGFAEHQYDYIGDAPGNTTLESQTDGKVVDLFSWVGASSTVEGDAVYGILASDNLDDYGNVAGEPLKSDWGKVFGADSKWRTPTVEEWRYLLETRENANIKKGWASVCGKRGTVILPDIFIDPMTNIGKDKAFFPLALEESTYYNWNVYDAAGWLAMADAGAVFLPAAGYHHSYLGGDWRVDAVGFYQSASSKDVSTSWYVLIDPIRLESNVGDAPRLVGQSVRLIREL